MLQIKVSVFIALLSIFDTQVLYHRPLMTAMQVIRSKVHSNFTLVLRDKIDHTFKPIQASVESES